MWSVVRGGGPRGAAGEGQMAACVSRVLRVSHVNAVMSGAGREREGEHTARVGPPPAGESSMRESTPRSRQHAAMRRAWRSGEGVGQKPPRVHDYDDPGGRPGRGEDGPRRIGTGGICNWPASWYSRWRRRGSYKPARRGGQAPQRPRRPRRRSTSMTIRGQLEKRERKESSVRSL